MLTSKGEQTQERRPGVQTSRGLFFLKVALFSGLALPHREDGHINIKIAGQPWPAWPRG